METIGSKIHELNVLLGKDNYRISYSAKINKYYIFDTKYNFRFYEFSSQDKLLNISLEELKGYINEYKNSSKFKTALQKYKQAFEKYLIDHFGLELFEILDGKIVVKNGINIYSLKYEESKINNFTDLKMFIARNIKKLS